MKPTIDQIGSLLALKRDERPEEGYWQDFLCEFHQKQREDAVKRQTIAGLWERTTEWFRELGGVKWIYGGGLAYAALMTALLVLPDPRGADVERTAAPVNHQVIPAPAQTVEQLDRLDLAPSTTGNSGEQEF